MTTTSSSPRQDPRNDHPHHESELEEEQSIIRISATITNSCWKLYENPFFTSSTHTCIFSAQHQTSHFQKQLQRKYSAIAKRIHGHGHAHAHAHSHAQDLNKLIRNSLTSSMDRQAQAQIAELKAELDLERKVRRKMEAANKRLAKELAEERGEREEMERRWEEMRRENLRVKGEMAQMRRRKGMEVDHQMLRMADQDRPQMKLSVNNGTPPRNRNRDKISSCSSASSLSSSSTSTVYKCVGESKSKSKRSICAGGENTFNDSNSNTTRVITSSNNINPTHIRGLHRKMREPETENPHIKRGIRGFVEFPRVVKFRAMRINAATTSHSISNASIGRDDTDIKSKLECQTGQLQVSLKHKMLLPSNPIPQFHVAS